MIKMYKNWKDSMSQSTQWLIESIVDTGLIISACYAFYGALVFLKHIGIAQ
jgi:hypothetical protein